MLTEYIAQAMRMATYKLLDEGEGFYGGVTPELGHAGRPLPHVHISTVPVSKNSPQP